MNKYLYILLHHPIWDLSITIIFILNAIILTYLDNKNEKNNSKEIITNNQEDKIYQFKITILLLAILIILIYFANQLGYIMIIVCFFIAPTISLIKSIINIYINKQSNYSLENKYIYLMSTLIYILFFSSTMITGYIQILNSIPHIYKEILLIIFLIFKISLFTFLLVINIFIFISNTNEILLLKINKKLSTFFINTKKQVTPIYYDFILYKKYKTKKVLTIDKLLFILQIIPAIILNSILFIIIFVINYIKSLIYKILSKLEDENKWNNIIKKTTNISFIISILCVYILTITLKEKFLIEIKEIYAFIASVILIPLIYDSIKNKY